MLRPRTFPKQQTNKSKKGLVKEKKKLTKKQILALPLTSFGIRPLTLWVERPRKKLEQISETLRRYKKMDTEGPGNKNAAAVASLQRQREDYRQMVDLQPKTAADLKARHPYRFTHKILGRHSRLGKKPITELKARLLDMGLTADDWPALVPHNELLKHLSKKAIKQIPVTEILSSDWACTNYLRDIFSCAYDDLPKHCLGDFLKANPLNVVESNSKYYAIDFLRRHKQRLICIQQHLVSKGFTTRDGSFFRWDPATESREKARRILSKYVLPNDMEDKFVGIIVRERWVI